MNYGALIFGNIIDNFQNFNFQHIMYELSFEQIVVAVVAAVLCVLFGFFAGACIIYPVAFRKGMRVEKDNNQLMVAQRTNANIEKERRAQETQRASNVADTFDQHTEDEYGMSEWDDEPEEVAPVADVPAAVAEQPAPVAAIATPSAAEPMPAAEPVEAPVAVAAAAATTEPSPAVIAATPAAESVIAATDTPAPVVTAAPAPAHAATAAPAPAVAHGEDVLPLVREEFANVPDLIDMTPTEDSERLGATGVYESAVLEDHDFLRLVEESRRRHAMVNRTAVLAYCHIMRPLAPALPIRIVPAETVAYDRIKTDEYTFALVFERKKVLKLYLRLHPNTVQALQKKAEAYVRPATQLGDDWYSWIVTDIEGCERLVAKVLDMSYKYASHAIFARDRDGALRPTVPSDYENKLCDAANRIVVEEDADFVSVSDALNQQYRLEYFGRKDACRFVTEEIHGEMIASAQDEVASCAAILKANTHIFAIVFEAHSVVKVIFRAPAAYVEELRLTHRYVGNSEFPHNGLHWYYAILDDFTPQECCELLRRCYDHMITRYLVEARH